MRGSVTCLLVRRILSSLPVHFSDTRKASDHQGDSPRFYSPQVVLAVGIEPTSLGLKADCITFMLGEPILHLIK